MVSKPMIYGGVLAALAGAAFWYLSTGKMRTPHALALVADVQSQSDPSRRTDHPGAFATGRTAGASASLIASPDSRTPAAPLVFRKILASDRAHGVNLERRIRQRLGDPDPDARVAALGEVYALDGKDIVPLLHEVLLKEKNGTVFREAATVLANIAGEAAVSLVTTALGDPDVAVRRQAIEALGAVGLHGQSLLGQMLLGDPEPALRLRALELLAAEGGPAAVALLRAAVNDADPEISEAAMDALRSQLGSHWRGITDEASDALYSAASGLSVDPANPILGFSRNSHPDERIQVIRNLRFSDEADAFRTLQAVLEQDEDESVREEALFALDDIGGETAVSVIATALGDDSPTLRRRAIETLWRSGSSDALPLLGQVLYADPDPDLRLEAVGLLGADSAPAARALLVAAREDPDERVSQYADRLLGE